MSTDELKIDVINQISQINEVRIFKEIQKLLDFELEKGFYQINELQKARLIEAKSDIVLTEEEANKEIDEWLQKNKNH
jgi:hypothetical protein